MYRYKKKRILVFVMILAGINGIIVELYASEFDSQLSISQVSEITSEIYDNSSEVNVEEESDSLSEEIVTENQLNPYSHSEVVEQVTNPQLEDVIQIQDYDQYQLKESATPALLLNDNQLKDDENLVEYSNQVRLAAGSGESRLVFKNTSQPTTKSNTHSQILYYTLDSDGEVSSESKHIPRTSNQNIITVVDGEIVDSSNAIIRTSGGYENSFYIYPSINDLKNNTNGVPISGGGYDGTFIETIEEDGIYYHRIKISGYEGYVLSGNVQIIPKELIKAKSYYTVEDNDWIYYSAIDSLTSSEYERVVIDQAPVDANAGVKYYSDDDTNFYTTPILTNIDERRAAVNYNSYFMNLPMRSESSYTASNYQAYLKSKGKTASMYYNATSAFTDAQSLESVNSLLIFSMANHESAYGLSTYAKACYNFFGRGAIDSDPDKACQSYSFNTARDGILAQAIFLQTGYFDIFDYRYSGTNVGNKQSGLNVYYASDPDWGKKISNHAYMIDQYLGGKEENKYPILSVSGNSYVYQDANLTKPVKSIGDYSNSNYYNIKQQAGSNGLITVVAVAETTNAYQIYVPTAVKNNQNVDCSFTSAMRGSYPDYNGRTKKTINLDTANYTCDYVSFPNNTYWISKTNTTNLNGVEVPAITSEIIETYSNGKTRFKFFINPSTNAINYALGYNSSGQVISGYEYQPGTQYGSHAGKIKYKFFINSSTNTINYALGYNTNGKVISAYEYQSGTKYRSHAGKIKYKFFINPSTNTINYALGYNANGKVISAYEYQSETKYRSHARKIKYKFYINPVDATLRYALGYNTNGQLINGYEYQGGTKYRSHGGKIKYKFYINPNTNMLNYAYRYNEENKCTLRYNYLTQTKYRQGHGARISSRIYY